MQQSTDEMVKESLAAMERLRQKIGTDPKKAQAFLIRAGLAERDPDGKLRLAKPYR